MPSSAGVLRALRDGSFFADHGRIVRGAVFRARGFSLLETGTRLAFYTNPVRVTVAR